MLKSILVVVTTVAAFALNYREKDSDLPINHFQFIGSHNSYKEYIDPKLVKLIEKMDTTRSLKGLEYHHVGLSEQLNLGLRALAIDIAADEKGGKYARPKGLDWAGKTAKRPYDTEGVMNEPGFKVLHVQDIDFRSNCLTLKKGYFVRTRADADTREARTNDYSRFKAAQESGAQIISTDYYFKSTLFPSEYSVHFEGKTYFRKNPFF